MNDEERAAYHEALRNAPVRDIATNPIPGLSSNPEAAIRQLKKLDMRNRMTPEMKMQIDISTLDFILGGTGELPPEDDPA